MSVEMAQNSFLLFETLRSRRDFTGLELYCFEGLCYSFKVTLHVLYLSLYLRRKLKLHYSVAWQQT